MTSLDAFELAVDDPLVALQRAVPARMTMLIAGGTSSGKTTLLDALVREIPATERALVVDDTIDAHDRLVRGLASRPDRIVLAELRTDGAAPFLPAIHAGHAGSMTTIHADSPRAALERVAAMVIGAGLATQTIDALAYAASAFDLVVQLDRRGGYRRIAQIATARDLVA